MLYPSVIAVAFLCLSRVLADPQPSNPTEAPTPAPTGPPSPVCDEYNSAVVVTFDTTGTTHDQREHTTYNLFYLGEISDTMNTVKSQRSKIRSRASPAKTAFIEEEFGVPIDSRYSGNVHDGYHCVRAGYWYFVANSGNGFDGTVKVHVNGELVYNATDYGYAAGAIFQTETETRPPSAAPVAYCDSGLVEVSIVVDPDDNPDQISYSLISVSDGTVYASGGVGTGIVYGEFTSQTDDIASIGGARVCVPCDTSYVFSIADCAGDGLCCAHGYGQYLLEVDGDVEKVGGQFQYGEQYFFTTAACLFQ